LTQAVEIAFSTLDNDEEAFRFAVGIERVAYANSYPTSLNEGVKFSTETFDDEGVRGDLGAERYANMALQWATRPGLPITVVGGCCGILPEHIREVTAKVKSEK
jgi:S-methylmethionine-dependent homocysteine/selenocysteine methylase